MGLVHVTDVVEGVACWHANVQISVSASRQLCKLHILLKEKLVFLAKFSECYLMLG